MPLSMFPLQGRYINFLFGLGAPLSGCHREELYKFSDGVDEAAVITKLLYSASL